jgi:hypothetical protein
MEGIMIRGLSERRRLPRAGKIKLGVMVQPPGGGKAYPRATDYFVYPAEVQEVFGPAAKALRITFPLDDTAALFPQSLKMYRKGGGLFCAGDGDTAKRWDEKGELVERTCPCAFLDDGQCKPTAVLNFILPEVKGLGIWQMVVHGKTAIVGINSALEHFSATFGGLRGIPFLLKLGPEDTQRWDDKRKEMVRQTIMVPSLGADVSYMQVLDFRRALGAKVEAMMLPAAPDHETEDTEDDEDEGQGVQVSPPRKGEALSGSPDVVTSPDNAAPAARPGGTPVLQPAAVAAVSNVPPKPPELPAWAKQPPPKPQTSSPPAVETPGLFGKTITTMQVAPWTIEACYRAATSFGISAKEYGTYLESVYRTADIDATAIQEQAEMFEGAESDGPQARDQLVKTIRLKARKISGRKEP